MSSRDTEFDRQLENLLRKGYPKLARISQKQFIRKIEPLRKGFGKLAVAGDRTKRGRIPFVIVVKSDLVSPESAMPLVEVKGNAGSVNMHPVEASSFKTIPDVDIPSGTVYLLLDVDTGKKTLNLTPARALKTILRQKRSPLIIDEGVALAIQFPEVLHDKKSFNCYSIPGSRRDDQRVPAMWISCGKPRLGWCGDNNPHTWLCSASCGGRAGV
ncbi:MAG: DUF5701 family protein [Candidatus Aureabacteria bacterium]|nr:DUF5701 family protein [Candidatus Auribacterota bacterium]